MQQEEEKILSTIGKEKMEETEREYTISRIEEEVRRLVLLQCKKTTVRFLQTSITRVLKEIVTDAKEIGWCKSESKMLTELLNLLESLPPPKEKDLNDRLFDILDLIDYQNRPSLIRLEPLEIRLLRIKDEYERIQNRPGSHVFVECMYVHKESIKKCGFKYAGTRGMWNIPKKELTLNKYLQISTKPLELDTDRWCKVVEVKNHTEKIKSASNILFSSEVIDDYTDELYNKI